MVRKCSPNSVEKVCLSVRDYKEPDLYNESKQVERDLREEVKISDSSISD